ncbi:24290_t:CDS:2, partial [Racocetra persica]
HFIGVFASYVIAPGAELTYDYNFSTFGGAQEQECFCGAPNCRGLIGGKHRSTTTKCCNYNRALEKRWFLWNDLHSSLSEG